MLQALVDRQLAPCKVCDLRRRTALLVLVVLGDSQQLVRAFGIAIQHHVLDCLSEFIGQVCVNGKLPRIDDTHVHSGVDGVIQED